MERCPRCKTYQLVYNMSLQLKVCCNIDCLYEEHYCREKWAIEHDCLSSLLGKPNVIKEKCRNYSLIFLNLYEYRTYECLDCEYMQEKIKLEETKRIISNIL